MLEIGMTCLFFYGLSYIFMNIEGKGMKEASQFDIKKAKDVTEKLDDVKGIDEIKDEIKNLIRMIQNP